MIENIERIGNITSSNVYKLMTLNRKKDGFGTPALTYIQDKIIERKLGRSIETNTYSKDMMWGLFLEKRVFSMLGIEYKLEGKKTQRHPTINGWSGSYDVLADNKVGDIKCFQPKNFAKYSDVILDQDVDVFKLKFPKEYWQLISNAIINNVTHAEAICYMPYKSDLNSIREEADNSDEYDQLKLSFIVNSEDRDLAYLPYNGFYKDLNTFCFEVPENDKILLEIKILEALKIIENER